MNFETLTVVHYVVVDFISRNKRAARKFDAEKTASSWHYLERFTSFYSFTVFEAIAEKI